MYQRSHLTFRFFSSLLILVENDGRKCVPTGSINQHLDNDVSLYFEIRKRLHSQLRECWGTIFCWASFVLHKLFAVDADLRFKFCFHCAFDFEGSNDGAMILLIKCSGTQKIQGCRPRNCGQWLLSTVMMLVFPLYVAAWTALISDDLSGVFKNYLFLSKDPLGNHTILRTIIHTRRQMMSLMSTE